MLITPQVKIGTVPAFCGANGTGLLQTLVAWVTGTPATPGLDWVIEMNQESTNDDGVTISFPGRGHRQYILSNTGVSGNENIIIGMRESSTPASQIFEWVLNGYTYVPLTWNGHASGAHGLTISASTLPCMQMFDNEIAYWFYSTKEFIFVSIRVGTSNFQCYLGNGARLGPPSSYPYPLCIAGSHEMGFSYTVGGYGPVRPNHDTSSPYDISCFAIDAGGAYLKWPFGLRVVPGQQNQNVLAYGAAYNGAALIMPCFYTVEYQVTLFQLFNVGTWRKTNSQSEQEYVDEEGNKWRVFAQGKNDYEYDFLCVFEEAGVSTTTTTV
jgi:hypothetical protein